MDNSNNLLNENDTNISMNILQKQNLNLKNQIVALTKRIKEYENDYIKDKDSKTNQLKEFSQIEIELNNQINQKTKIINSLQEENDYLKNYINQMENDLNGLKNEVKNLLKLKLSDESKMEFNNLKESNMGELVKKYSNEISYLRNQNNSLMNSLHLMNDNIKQNKNINSISI